MRSTDHALLNLLRRKRRATESSLSREALPPIWLGKFTCNSDWQQEYDLSHIRTCATKEIDDAIISSRRPSTHLAWCSICLSLQSMAIDWHDARFHPDGTVLPQWSDIARCGTCLSGSQLRALLEFADLPAAGRRPNPAIGLLGTFSQELVRTLQTRNPGLAVSSHSELDRFAALDVRWSNPGSANEPGKAGILQRGRLDVLMVHRVLETIAQPERALESASRLLRRKGVLLLAVPFDEHATDVVVTNPTGTNLDPAVPTATTTEGDDSQPTPLPRTPHTFGWGLLDLLRSVGFATASAHQYWGPWHGHLGGPMFIFEARR